jgi:hypothetical protein
MKKPEIVDARQFTGGITNGMDLVLWVNSNEGKATWLATPERIRVAEDAYSMIFAVAYPGDWIMRNQDGTFTAIRKQELDSEYDQV